MEHDLISEIEAYCAATGISPATLGVRALGNSRFLERLQRRKAKLATDTDRLRDFMRDNPPPQQET